MTIVLQRLADNGLTLNKEKSKLFKESVEFLGYKVDKSGLSVPESRINAINKIKIPSNVSEVKSFMGLVTYYSKFVPNLAKLAHPLYKFLEKDQKWIWAHEQNQAVNDIKAVILSKNILSHYDPTLKLVLCTDASAVGISGILSQLDANGKERPLAFCSRTLSTTEMKYSAIDKEALAIVYSVKYFHQYLYGQEFVLKTDHKPLVSIFGEKKKVYLSCQPIGCNAMQYFYKVIITKFSI